MMPVLLEPGPIWWIAWATRYIIEKLDLPIEAHDEVIALLEWKARRSKSIADFWAQLWAAIADDGELCARFVEIRTALFEALDGHHTPVVWRELARAMWDKTV